MEETKIKLNGQFLTIDQFEEKKQEFESQNIQLIETGPQEYKTRLRD